MYYNIAMKFVQQDSLAHKRASIILLSSVVASDSLVRMFITNNFFSSFHLDFQSFRCKFQLVDAFSMRISTYGCTWEV